jgi:hypothetical protein
VSAVRPPLLALLLALLASPAGAQESGSEATSGEAVFSLGPAFPNPFERETRIPFVLGEELFRDGGRPVVSMRVYNLLHQLVGFASLAGAGEEDRRLEGLALDRPGRHEAVWDGRDADGDLVTEGPYFIQISVNGRTQVRKVVYVR